MLVYIFIIIQTNIDVIYAIYLNMDKLEKLCADINENPHFIKNYDITIETKVYQTFTVKPYICIKRKEKKPENKFVYSPLNSISDYPVIFCFNINYSTNFGIFDVITVSPASYSKECGSEYYLPNIASHTQIVIFCDINILSIQKYIADIENHLIYNKKKGPNDDFSASNEYHCVDCKRLCRL